MQIAFAFSRLMLFLIFMLKGKKILLGITGSIAAYKAILLTRLFIKAGAEVKILTTPAAKDFITPLTLSTLSKNPVLSDIFKGEQWENHVMLGRWADVMIIAPLSCNTLSKMANGLCDNLLMAVYLSATCPVVVAPAMDEDMWHHPSTQANLEQVKSFGNQIIPVNSGELASGLIGEGRMAEPEAVFQFIESFLNPPLELKGKIALVTAGPTYEPLDPVRFVGNHSSGKMGIAIAHELKNRGAAVKLVLGPVQQSFEMDGISVIHINTAEEMYNTCMKEFENADITVMAAAVADYTPLKQESSKIKKKDELFTLELKKTKDILKSLGEVKSPNQVLVGFALETDNARQHAIEKLKAKKADMIILNSMKDEGAGFGGDTNKITIFDKSGAELQFNTKSKQDVAKDIVNTIIDVYYA